MRNKRGSGASTGECSVEGCTLPRMAKFMCRGHYYRLSVGLPLDPPLRRPGTPYDLNKAKITTAKSGYRVFNVPRQAPDGTSISPGYQIKEHTFVMLQKLGRELLPGENVHHINGNRGDNRPENLELWVTSQPPGQRPEDLVAWAREILQRYAG